MSNVEYGFDRRDFLLKIVRQFNTKSNKFIIERVYNQMLDTLEKQRTPFNQMDITEKIRILKECYRSFKSDEFRAGLKGVRPRKIAQDFGEEMLGIAKRNYDMSRKFSPSLIISRKLPDGTNKKMVGIKPLEEDDDRTIPYVSDERGITIQQIGELVYNDGIDIINDIKQYRVTIPAGYKKEVEKVIFTSMIDFELLANDSNYEEAVMTELLNIYNLEYSNAGGYIGEIVKSKQMEPGTEKDDEAGCYTYQISDTYAINVDPIAVSAAKILESRQKVKEDEGR